MAHQEDKDFISKFVVLMAVLVLIAAAIFLVARLLTVAERTGVPSGYGDVAQAMVEERIRPVGRVATAASEADAAPARRSDADIYAGVCAACHDTGAAGAPRKGDEAAWSERLGQGFDTVVQRAIDGVGAMPARGGDSSLSDDDMRLVVAYLLEQSGQTVDAGVETETAQDEPASGNGAASDEDTETAAEEASPGEAVAGDASAGQAKYAACAACHGAKGEGQAVFPKLAGTPPERIVELLKKYRAGEQVGPQTALMAPNAKALSDEDIADLAAYIDTL